MLSSFSQGVRHIHCPSEKQLSWGEAAFQTFSSLKSCEYQTRGPALDDLFSDIPLGPVSCSLRLLPLLQSRWAFSLRGNWAFFREHRFVLR